MATITQKKRDIKYLNKDFEGFKRDLIEHLRIYFPNDVQDFNESSSGMMLLEMMAFIGDNMSYYLDKKFEESFTPTARERKNLLRHGKQLGFKAFGKTAAIGTVDGYLKVPATASNEEIIPDTRYAGDIKRGAKCKSDAGKTYETLIDADFSTVSISDESLVRVGDRDPQTDVPTTFVLKLGGIPVKAGETKSATFTVGGYEAFRTLTLEDDDVLEVLSVKDSAGNEWLEVDYLAQDTIFDGVANVSGDRTDVPFVLKVKSVPYRFISEYNVETGKTSLIFGSGDAEEFDGSLIPDLGDLALPLYGRDAFTDFAIDPQNYLKTRTLGLAPVNTDITVSYRVGGGLDTNAGTGQVNTVSDVVFDVGNSTLPTSTVNDVAGSFEVLNSNPITGGSDEKSIEELRELIAAHFATQMRTVTAEDFVVRALTMPSKFGSVFRVGVNPSPTNKMAVELFVLSQNSSGNVVVAPGDLKTNLKKYLERFRMLTDAVEILDGDILNIAVEFEVLTNPDFNKSEVVTNCIETLKEFFEIEKWQLNQPINKTDIFRVLSEVAGVLSVIRFDVVSRVGTFDGRSYSTTPYVIGENTRNGIIYCRENSIFEIKYPNRDIVGTAK